MPESFPGLKDLQFGVTFFTVNVFDLRHAECGGIMQLNV